MNEATAISLFRKSISAGFQAELRGIPEHEEESAGSIAIVPLNYEVRITNTTGGELGPGVLDEIAAANVSLASSDALLR